MVLCSLGCSPHMFPLTLAASIFFSLQRAIGKFASAILALPRSILKLPKTILQYLIRAAKVSAKDYAVLFLVFVYGLCVSVDSALPFHSMLLNLYLFIRS